MTKPTREAVRTLLLPIQASGSHRGKGLAKRELGRTRVGGQSGFAQARVAAMVYLNRDAGLTVLGGWESIPILGQPLPEWIFGLAEVLDWIRESVPDLSVGQQIQFRNRLVALESDASLSPPCRLLIEVFLIRTPIVAFDEEEIWGRLEAVDEETDEDVLEALLNYWHWSNRN